VSDPAARAVKSYVERHGTEPTGVWGAPGRVNLIGEHTDYNDGYVLPFALPHLTAVAASVAAPAASGAPDRPQWTVWSEQTDETVHFGPDDLVPGRITGWAAYVAGVVWVLREAGFPVPGARLAIASDVPLGAGLSSSAALECAVLTALADLGGFDLPVRDRPRLAQRAENDYAGMPCGIMDQSAATLCVDGHALFLDCRTLAVEQIPFDVAAQGLAVLVIDTKAPHRHVDNEYRARRAACETAAARLGVPALRDISVAGLDGALSTLDDEVLRRRVRHVVTEDQRVLDTVDLLRAGDVAGIGPLMTASHVSLRDDYEVTVPEVDTAVDAALEAGSYGARITGGGFGGCVLALVDTGRAESIGAAVAKAYAARGFAAPAWFVAVPGQGARRL
jgi:galactokinase